jgi:hypothetical protein
VVALSNHDAERIRVTIALAKSKRCVIGIPLGGRELESYIGLGYHLAKVPEEQTIKISLTPSS